jgi:hypothetical protein
MDVGGWLWFVIDVIAVLILGGAMLYGARMWRQRPRDAYTERASDEKTRELYHHPNTR